MLLVVVVASAGGVAYLGNFLGIIGAGLKHFNLLVDVGRVQPFVAFTTFAAFALFPDATEIWGQS